MHQRGRLPPDHQGDPIPHPVGKPGDTLIVTSVRTGAELDRVTLVDGRLTYRTGRARPLFDGLRKVRPDLSDERLFALRTGWSNGYLAANSGGP